MTVCIYANDQKANEKDPLLSLRGKNNQNHNEIAILMDMRHQNKKTRKITSVAKNVKKL